MQSIKKTYFFAHCLEKKYNGKKFNQYFIENIQYIYFPFSWVIRKAAAEDIKAGVTKWVAFKDVVKVIVEGVPVVVYVDVSNTTTNTTRPRSKARNSIVKKLY